MTAAEDLDNGWSVPRESIGAAAAANYDSKAHRPLTGDWRGFYDYLGGTGVTSSFTARIEDDGTQLRGEKIDPDRHGGSTLRRASIVGVRESSTLKFTANSVEFLGTISEDGNTIIGTWDLQIFDGPFEMHRVDVPEVIST